VLMSQDSSIHIATACGLDDRGSISGGGRRSDSSLLHPDRFWVPLSLLSNRYRGVLSLEVKRPEHDADHSPPSAAEVKNSGAIPPLPIHLLGVMLH
jgi:hypothetical protein